jgi:hypothetical protein
MSFISCAATIQAELDQPQLNKQFMWPFIFGGVLPLPFAPQLSSNWPSEAALVNLGNIGYN